MFVLGVHYKLTCTNIPLAFFPIDLPQLMYHIIQRIQSKQNMGFKYYQNLLLIVQSVFISECIDQRPSDQKESLFYDVLACYSAPNIGVFGECQWLQLHQLSAAVADLFEWQTVPNIVADLTIFDSYKCEGISAMHSSFPTWFFDLSYFL